MQCERMAEEFIGWMSEREFRDESTVKSRRMHAIMDSEKVISQDEPLGDPQKSQVETSFVKVQSRNVPKRPHGLKN